MKPREPPELCDPIRLGPLLWTRLIVGLLEMFRLLVVMFVMAGRLVFTILGLSTKRRTCGVLSIFFT